MKNKLIFATSNRHKLAEVIGPLAEFSVAVVGLDALVGVPDEPVENADTFEGNARLKAIGYAAQLGDVCLAEDSGLEVDALDGAPGVYSARYSGRGATRDERDHHNNEKLLAALKGVPQHLRQARFVCAMCVARPDGTVLAEARGTFEGLIAEAPRGENGFGYDPLLWLPDVACTSGELSAAAKFARSHRGSAVRALVKTEWLRSLKG